MANSKKAPTRRILFDVVGESFTSKSGRSRQDLILAIEPGELVTLKREPENPHDTNAVLVLVAGHDIGHLSRDDAALLSPALDDGIPYKAQVQQIRGGVKGFPSIGVVIAIAWLDKELPKPRMRDDEQKDYRQQHARKLLRNPSLPSQRKGCLSMLFSLTNK